VKAIDAAIVAVSLGLGLGLGLASAQAATAPPPPGRILFIKEGALFSVVADGKATPQRLAVLPESIGAATWLSTSRDGGLVVVQGDKGAAWRSGSGGDWRLDCTGHAQPAADGTAVLCESGGVARLYDPLEPAGGGKAISGAREANFWGGPRALVVLTDDGVVSFQVESPRKRKRLARAGALGNLEVAPDGTQAVAVFGKGAASRIEIFMLDGEGVPRKLGGPGVPLGWSWDSAWVLIEEGAAPPDDGDGTGGDEGGAGEEGLLLGSPAPPWIGVGMPPWFGVTKKVVHAKPTKTKRSKGTRAAKAARRKAAQREAAATAKFGDGGKINVRACVARATGGETKCWNGYSPRGLSPESQQVLLFKDGVLAIGKLAGVRPEPPHKILDGVTGPATWIP
jgi:hypothetical protein